MEIKTTREIRAECYVNELGINKKWVAVDDIFDFIEKQIDEGNVKPRGFSPAICLSTLKKSLVQK